MLGSNWTLGIAAVTDANLDSGGRFRPLFPDELPQIGRRRGAAVVLAYLIHYLRWYLIPILSWQWEIFYYEQQTSLTFDPGRFINPKSCPYPLNASYEIQTSDYQNFEICWEKIVFMTELFCRRSLSLTLLMQEKYWLWWFVEWSHCHCPMMQTVWPTQVFVEDWSPKCFPSRLWAKSSENSSKFKYSVGQAIFSTNCEKESDRKRKNVGLPKIFHASTTTKMENSFGFDRTK